MANVSSCYYPATFLPLRPLIPLPPYKKGPRSRLYLANQVLVFAAEELGYPYEVVDYDESLLAFGRGKRRVLVHKEILPLNDRAVDWAFEHKWLGYLVLAGASLPLPKTFLATSWDQIVKAAKKYKCDLIAMASHGRSGFTKLLLGSETTKVLSATSIPVLVLR